MTRPVERSTREIVLSFAFLMALFALCVVASVFI